MATKDNLTMETKDGLTRDEAREAIGILALRKDNLDPIAIAVGSIAVALFIAFFTIVISYNNISNLFGLVFIFFIVAVFILVVSVPFLFYLRSKSNKLYDKANKLAEKYNLKEFFNATLEKDSIFVRIKRIIKK